VAKKMAFRGEKALVTGTITRAEETNASENETEIVYYQFQYVVNGETYGGESYTTGWRYDQEQNAQIEYLKSDPGLARLVDGRWSQFPVWVVFLIGIFPGIGALFIGGAMAKGFRALRLLRYGQVAHGRLINKEATNVSVNEQTVYALTFRFTAESTGREHTVVARTHQTHLLEDEEEEPLLYLPSHPEYAFLFDNLPGAPTVNQRGYLEGSLLGGLVYLVLPTLGSLTTLYVVNDLYQAVFG
jgi:hypothetical protein